MDNSKITYHKVLVLPAVLEADSIYYVKNGDEFDVYVTNNSGTITGFPQKQISVLNTFGDSPTATVSQIALTHRFNALDVSLGNKVDVVVGKGLSANDYTNADKTKLDNIENEATKNNEDSFLLDRANHTGTQPISSVTGLETTLSNKVTQITGKGLTTNDFTNVLKSKLDAIATNATANSTDAQLRNRATHTGTQAISTITGLEARLGVVEGGIFSEAYRVKLDGIAANATKNLSNAHLLERANHTGTQPVSTITGLGSAATKNIGTAVGSVPTIGGTIGLTSSTDLNSLATINHVGEYRWGGNVPLNAPSGADYSYLRITSWGDGAQQLVIDSNGVYHRRSRANSAGGWTSWVIDYHTGNMPATATRWPTWSEVTGKPGSFAPSSHTHSYLPLGGGTLTGNLTVNGQTYATTFNSSTPYSFLNVSDAQSIMTGGVLASNAYADANKIPTNGIYSKGNIVTGGSFTASGNVTAYSDIKLKENIEVIPNALDKINSISGYTYERKDIEDSARHTGVIAQEVQKVLPEAVMEDEDGTLSVAYGNMVGLLIEAIKELKREINDMKGNE